MDDIVTVLHSIGKAGPEGVSQQPAASLYRMHAKAMCMCIFCHHVLLRPLGTPPGEATWAHLLKLAACRRQSGAPNAGRLIMWVQGMSTYRRHHAVTTMLCCHACVRVAVRGQALLLLRAASLHHKQQQQVLSLVLVSLPAEATSRQA